MDPYFLENLTIDQVLDALESKVETTYPNPESHSSDKAEWTKVNHYIERGRCILARMKNRHNAFNPIHQLPPEVLHQIFEQMQWARGRYEAIHPRYRRVAGAHREWLVVTKVCHYWRAVSYLFPSLWCNILVDPESDSRSLQSWFMERSAPMPFQISQDRWIFDSSSETPFMTMNRSALTVLHDSLSCCGSRLKSIFLQFDQELQDIIVKLLDLPLPSLVNLSLRHHAGPERFALLPQVFRGQPSGIRRLYLNRLWCWPANIETFKNLIHLVLAGTKTSMLEFLIMFKACPHLEILHLWNVYLEEADAVLPTHLSRLPSPRLKNLLVDALFYHPPPQLLRHLNLSPTTSVYMKWISGDSNGLSTLKELDTVRGANFEPQITTLEIQFGVQTTVCLHQNHLVLSVNSGLLSTLISLSGRFPALTEIRFSLANKQWQGRNAPNGQAESVYEQFLSRTPTLQTIHFKTPGFEGERGPLMNAISRSSTLIEELRITHASGQAGRVEEVVKRNPFPSYRLVTGSCVPVVDVFPFMAGLELTEFFDTDADTCDDF